jgi:hypothetical protein
MKEDAGSSMEVKQMGQLYCTGKQLNPSLLMCDVHKNLERQGVTIFWLQIIDDVSVQKSGKIKLRGVHGAGQGGRPL